MIKNHCLQILSVGKGEVESRNEDTEIGIVRKPFENTMEMEDPKAEPKVESKNEDPGIDKCKRYLKTQ